MDNKLNKQQKQIGKFLILNKVMNLLIHISVSEIDYAGYFYVST